MHSLAIQISPKIRVNVITSGTIDTDMVKSHTPEQRKQRGKENPLGKLVNPEEIANVVRFFYLMMNRILLIRLLMGMVKCLFIRKIFISF